MYDTVLKYFVSSVSPEVMGYTSRELDEIREIPLDSRVGILSRRLIDSTHNYLQLLPDRCRTEDVYGIWEVVIHQIILWNAAEEVPA